MENENITVSNEEFLHDITATAVAVSWERIFLSIDVKIEYHERADRQTPLVFYAVNGLNRAKAIYKSIPLTDDTYRLVMNITNPGDCRCLPMGTYRIAVCQNDVQVATVVCDPSIIGKMSDFGRIFLYAGRKKVYTVFFYVAEGQDILPFYMHVMASQRTGMAFPRNKKRKLPRPVLALKRAVARQTRPMLRRVYRFWSFVYRRRKNTVLFMTEQSAALGGNHKAVYERMVQRGMEKEYILLTSARPTAAERQSYRSWLSLMKKLGKSTLVFLDDHAPVLDWLKLNDRTEVVQLWHAGAGFKSSGYSRWGHLGSPAPQSCHRQYRYGIAGSRNIAHFFSEVWGINDEQVLPTGMPRMDQYLDENNRKRVTKALYEQFPLAKGKKVLLFAPTYRGTNKKNAYYPYELIDFERLYRLCGDEYVVFFKMHPWVHDSVPIQEEYADKFIDVGRYPNINDLFYITDLLVTDYSSNIFEYSLMRKPMLFFAFDKVQYSFSRGFHRDYEQSAPGKVCYSFDELLQAFENRDFDYQKVEKYVEHHFDYIDTHASDRVIDWIVLGNIPKDIAESIEKNQANIERMNRLLFEPVEEKEEQEPEGEDSTEPGMAAGGEKLENEENIEIDDKRKTDEVE